MFTCTVEISDAHNWTSWSLSPFPCTYRESRITEDVLNTRWRSTSFPGIILTSRNKQMESGSKPAFEQEKNPILQVMPSLTRIKVYTSRSKTIFNRRISVSYKTNDIKCHLKLLTEKRTPSYRVCTVLYVGRLLHLYSLFLLPVATGSTDQLIM